MAKECQTYYTSERIAVGRENVAKYEWAKATLKTALAGEPHRYYVGRNYFSAKACAELPDEFVWTLQPTTRIPRVYPHESKALCPVHGLEVRKISAWSPWHIDPIKHPYKIQCMLGGEWYPSSDYLTGDMTSGEFPDDGNGCEHKGIRYYFLREYAHHAYCSVTIPALRALTQAYVLTGERVYAHKAAVLLARLASEYPNFTDRKDRLFYATTGGRDPHYTWKTGGMFTNRIWESFCLEPTAYAYDALYDYIGEDADLLAFLKGKGLSVATAAGMKARTTTISSWTSCAYRGPWKRFADGIRADSRPTGIPTCSQSRRARRCSTTTLT